MYILFTLVVVIDMTILHDDTSFLGPFGTSAVNKGPFVYFLPTDKICGSGGHMGSPTVQIVQPAGIGRYMGVPKTTAAYLTSSSCGGPETSLALSFMLSQSNRRDFL